MEKRKILVLVNNDSAKEPFLTGNTAMRLKELEQYGAEFSFVVDTSLASNDRTDISPALRIEKEGPEWVKYNRQTLDAAGDAEVLLVGYNGVSTKLLAAAPKLKLVGVLRSGAENANLKACTEKDVIVCNSPGRSSEPVADLTVGLMIGFNRSISRDDLSKRKGWKIPPVSPFQPPLIGDSVIGLIGLGMIGTKVAKRLRGFGPRILACDPYANKDTAAALGVELVSMEELLKTSDFVSLHARLTPETEGLMGETEFSMMKPSSVFINTARAGLVDEPALIRTLEQKRIRGAALDVYSIEPLPDDHPLRKLDNVILIPHNGGPGAGDIVRIAIDIMREELHRYFRGEKLLNRMN